MKEVPLDSKQCNVMLVIKVNCCFPFIFMTDLKSTWKILILQDERVYKILCKWQFAEVSAEFMDVQGVGFIPSDFRYPQWDVYE